MRKVVGKGLPWLEGGWCPLLCPWALHGKLTWHSPCSNVDISKIDFKVRSSFFAVDRDSLPAFTPHA